MENPKPLMKPLTLDEAEERLKAMFPGIPCTRVELDQDGQVLVNGKPWKPNPTVGEEKNRMLYKETVTRLRPVTS